MQRLYERENTHHDVFFSSSQVPVPYYGPVGWDAAHCGATLWVGALHSTFIHSERFNPSNLQGHHVLCCRNLSDLLETSFDICSVFHFHTTDCRCFSLKRWLHDHFPSIPVEKYRVRMFFCQQGLILPGYSGSC